jgi:hypothetical protein
MPRCTSIFFCSYRMYRTLRRSCHDLWQVAGANDMVLRVQRYVSAGGWQLLLLKTTSLVAGVSAL